MVTTPSSRTWTPAERRVLDAVKICWERWGVDKVTIDDIARESGISRASLYRIFPGGRDVIFEAHRVHELDGFFTTLLGELDDTDNLHDLIARAVSVAMRELDADGHLGVMLAAEPGQVINELTVEGLPRIIRVATTYLVPLVDPYLPRSQGSALIDITVRLVISYFLVPSEQIDLSDERMAHSFVAPFLPEPHRNPTFSSGA